MEDGVLGIATDCLLKSEITSWELLLYMECRELFVGAGGSLDEVRTVMESKFSPELCERYLRMEEICQTIYKKMGEQEKRKEKKDPEVE